MWTLLCTALAGSLSLDVEVRDSLADVADFGLVATEQGVPPQVGSVVDVTSGAFLVVDMAATVHWEAGVPQPPESGKRGAPALSDWLVPQTLPSTHGSPQQPLTRSLLRRAPRAALHQEPTAKAVTHVDLYARTTQGIGVATVWFSSNSSDWTSSSAIELGPVDTLIARDVLLKDAFRHQLGLWVPDGEVGHQLQHVVYTAIIP